MFFSLPTEISMTNSVSLVDLLFTDLSKIALGRHSSIGHDLKVFFCSILHMKRVGHGL